MDENNGILHVDETEVCSFDTSHDFSLSHVFPREFEELWTADGRGNIGKCAFLYRELARTVGEDTLSNVLLEHWSELNEQTRLNFCYAAGMPDSMSLTMAKNIFNHPASNTHDRHLIAAGLASSARARKAESEIPPLLDRIGNYTDLQHQSILDRFRANARRQFQK